MKSMRRNKLNISTVICLLLFSELSFSQEESRLNYNDFIKNVQQYNPASKKADNFKKYGEAQYKAARGNYDPNINATYDEKQFSGSNYYTVLNSEIKQPIFTAQSLKLGYDYGIGKYVNPEVQTVSAGLPYLGLEVGVLQGLMIDKRRAEVLKAKAYANYYDSEQQIQLNDLLFDASQSYFNWLFSMKQLTLNKYFMEIAKQRLIGIEALANIGERPYVDTIEAAIFYQNRTMDYQGAILEYQKNSIYVGFYSLRSNGNDEVNKRYAPLDSLDLYYNIIKNNLLKELNKDQVSNPIVAQYRTYQRVLDVESRFKKEMIKPKLNVSYNFLSQGSSIANPVFSSNNYKWGANLAFPLLLRNSRNEFKMAKLNAENNRLSVMFKENEILSKINVLERTISLLSEQLINAERSVNYSKQLVEAEKLKFTNGESSLFMLNTRESKLLEFEIKLAEYKLKFIKTALNIIFLKGSLNYNL